MTTRNPGAVTLDVSILGREYKVACREDEREALGEAARRAVVSRWSWASVAERLLAPVT